MTITLVEQPWEQSCIEKLLHVVVLPYPAKGHSIPLLHFAKRLHSMGVMVTFVNTFSHLAREHFRTLEGLDRSTMRVVPLGVPPREGEGTSSLPFIHHVNELVADSELLVEGLFSQPGDAPPACIVSDMFLGWTQVSCGFSLQDRGYHGIWSFLWFLSDIVFSVLVVSFVVQGYSAAECFAS